MQKSDTNKAIRAHRKMGASTTLNRRYVKRPSRGTEALEASVQEVAQVEAIERMRQQMAEQTAKQAMARGGNSTAGKRATLAGVNLTTESDIAQNVKAKQRHVIQINEVKEQAAQGMQAQAMQQEQLEQQIQMGERMQNASALTMERQMQQGSALVPTMGATTHPLQTMAIERMRERKATGQRQRKSAKEIKEQEIKKALARTSKVIDKDIAKRERDQKRTKLHYGIARVMLAVSCTAVAVMAIVYFVGTNMPDISMRVAAMQTGINASYPGYVPRGFGMTDLSSEDGKVTMNFKSEQDDSKFTLIEESSSWDSNALETNYVKKELGDDYTVMREQGLTIYMGNRKATWVNGGVAYRIEMSSGELTKKQIQSIAASL